MHSLDVLDYSNQILGDQIWALNTLECYVLVMACYLHDVGMGISRKDFEVFEKELEPKGTLNESHSINEAQIIREQHNELSGMIIKKYFKLFDIFEKDIDAFGTHQSIRSVEVRSNHIELIVSPTEPRFVPLIEDLAEKIRQTLAYCRDVAQKRSESHYCIVHWH